ncbi:MAG: GSCFA domain-containing protein [Muribaculaceae bacterium]|nr:GSCFA domain-containing protein [Muribaculaceae bacterium]
MKFRTEIEPQRCNPISHDSRLLMLGSCFTTNIGEQLAIDGFNVTVNPTGVLYNPASIANMLYRASERRHYSHDDLFSDIDGTFHLLDFPNSFRNSDPEELLATGNLRLTELTEVLEGADTLIVTFGTAYVFDLISDGHTVGNCHKLPAQLFQRHRLTCDEIADRWRQLIADHRVIFTVSPIRHTADGLHGNTLSKATLQLAVEQLVEQGAEYFPAYEIMMDDLRDYRFYAADMKHPSETAVEYIYEIFKQRYFTPETLGIADRYRRQFKFSQHRQLL